MKWSGPDLTLAVECLGQCSEATEAAKKLTTRLRALGRIGSSEAVTYDMLKHAFRTAKMSSPSAYLGQPRRYSGAKPPDFDEDAVTVPRATPAPERPRDTEPAPPLEQPSNDVGEFAEPPDRAFIEPPPRAWPMPKTGSSRWLFVPDSHIPYHDTIAYRCMVNAARALRPDGIVIIGDFGDCYSTSFHEKDPARGSRLKEEMDAVNACLDELDSLGATTKVFCAGNHEARIDRYIAEKAKALYGIVTIPDLMRLSERGWTYVPFLATYAIGDALFTHTITKYGGINAHRQTRDAFNATSVVGHTHRLSWETRGDFFGDVRVGMSIGCLLSFELLDYEHKAKAARDWAHGFGVGTLDHETGRMHLQPVPIVKGRCVVDGRVVTA